MVSNFLVCVFAGAAFIRSFYLLDQWTAIGKIIALYMFIVVVRLVLILNQRRVGGFFFWDSLGTTNENSKICSNITDELIY